MSSYLIEVRTKQGVGEQGTCWLLASGVVVTAFHVVGSKHTRQWAHEGPDGDAIYVLRDGTRTIELAPLGFDPDADVALLRLKTEAPDLAVLRLALGPPPEGARWRGIAFPSFHMGQAYALTGQVSYQFRQESSRSLQLTINGGSPMNWEGTSGCPVCIDDFVFGVVTEVTDSAATGWAAPVDAVRRLASKCNVEVEQYAQAGLAAYVSRRLASLDLSHAFELVDYSGSPSIAEVLEQSRVSPATATLLAKNSLVESVVAIARERHFALIDGQSGSGKSTLALGAASEFAAEGWHVYSYIPPSERDSRRAMEELRLAAAKLGPAVILLDDVNLWASPTEIERIATLASRQVLMIATTTFLRDDEASRVELHLRNSHLALRWELLRPAVILLMKDREAEVTHWLARNHETTRSRQIGYDLVSTPLPVLVERYAAEAKTVWHFLFLLRGGAAEIRGDLERLVDNSRADIPVIYAAIEQIADVERSVTPDEVKEAMLPFGSGKQGPFDTTWITSVFEEMVRRRRMQRSRGAYTTVHRDWARSFISAAIERSDSRDATLLLLARDFRLDTLQPRRVIILWSWFISDSGGAGWFVRQWARNNRQANWSVLIGSAVKSGLLDTASLAEQLNTLFMDPHWKRDLGDAFAPHEAALKSLVADAGPSDWPQLRDLFFALWSCNPDLADRILQSWNPRSAAVILEQTDPIYYRSIYWLIPGLYIHDRAWGTCVGKHLSWDRLSKQFDLVQSGHATTFLEFVWLLPLLGLPLLRSRLRRIVDVLARVLAEARLRDFDFEYSRWKMYLYFFPQEVRRICDRINIKALAKEFSVSSPHDWGRLYEFTHLAKISDSSFGIALIDEISPELFIANMNKYKDTAAYQWRLLLWQLTLGSPETSTMLVTLLYEDILSTAGKNKGEQENILKALTTINPELGQQLAKDLGLGSLQGDISHSATDNPDAMATHSFFGRAEYLASLDQQGEDYDINEVIGFQFVIDDPRERPTEEYNQLSTDKPANHRAEHLVDKAYLDSPLTSPSTQNMDAVTAADSGVDQDSESPLAEEPTNRGGQDT